MSTLTFLIKVDAYNVISIKNPSYLRYSDIIREILQSEVTEVDGSIILEEFQMNFIAIWFFWSEFPYVTKNWMVEILVTGEKKSIVLLVGNRDTITNHNTCFYLTS